MSDTLTTLGTILAEDQPRDAVHVAVMCAIAGETLRPGQHIGLTGQWAYSKEHKQDSTTVTNVGIVDPFLRRPVMEGQKFWLYLYPNTITSLRHDWTHPEIDK